MSSKRRRRNQCDGKTRHKSKEDADYVVYLLRRDNGLLMGAYRGRFCHHWHVGHTTRQRIREKVRRLLSWSLKGESGAGNPGR